MAEDQVIDSGTPEPAGASTTSVESPQTAPAEKISLRDELTKNFNELREPKELRGRKPAMETPHKGVDASRVGASADRARDDTGKFIAKDEK